MASLCKMCGKKKPFLLKGGFQNFEGHIYCSKCLEKVHRNAFCQVIQPFVDAKLVREFYYNQHYSICNFANCMYGLILYGKSPLEVVFVTPSQVDFMNLEMYNVFSEIRKMRQNKAKVFAILSNDLFVKLLEIKKTDISDITTNIDANLEEYWSKRSGERIKEYELPPMDLV